MNINKIMHVRIRKVTASTKKDDILLIVSKTTRVKDLQTRISKKINVQIDQQKLYYRGKELIGDHHITDYDIKSNDVIQLMIKLIKVDNVKETDKDSSTNKTVLKETINNKIKQETTSNYFKIGDRIDMIDADMGAWFEAKILNIFTKNTNPVEEDLIFKIKMDRNLDTAPLEVKFKDIRPRARYVYKYSELLPGMIVLVNYNVEQPSTRGYWYSFEITEVSHESLKGTLLMGDGNGTIEDCVVTFKDEVMRIEESVLLTEREENTEDIPLRRLPLYCNKCKDIQTKNCKACGCKVCAKKESEGVLILCDECDGAYHLSCLKPPLEDVPTESWYCPECKVDPSEIVQAGEKLKSSKQKSKMISNKEGGTTRDWGKGMAGVGQTTECTIVPKHHYGPVPGVEVGTCWKFRFQVSEAGIHRHHVAGIHGRENDGVYSIVLSGGYEDYIDNGEEFYYTPSEGRHLSGNRKVTLTGMNKALALNCNVEFNGKTGGKAHDWRKGKPIRVVRSHKLHKPYKYTPLEGHRYDGIYKVVEYFPVKGKSDFIVWRYLLQRDDPAPVPWANGRREFDMIYPDGYLEAFACTKEAEEEDKKRKQRGKRKQPSSPNNSVTNYFKSSKKSKIEPYKPDEEVKKMIKQDTANKKLWDECKGLLKEGKQEFLNKVKEMFVCACCQEILYEPITIICLHNVCKSCLKKSFRAEIYVCPLCRFDLTKNDVMKENKNLGRALKALFSGYEAGR